MDLLSGQEVMMGGHAYLINCLREVEVCSLDVGLQGLVDVLGMAAGLLEARLCIVQQAPPLHLQGCADLAHLILHLPCVDQELLELVELILRLGLHGHRMTSVMSLHDSTSDQATAVSG